MDGGYAEKGRWGEDVTFHHDIKHNLNLTLSNAFLHAGKDIVRGCLCWV